ncbi:MAG TPA: fumarylacetoacetate hydrolase family protein [Chloroflexota bacterium]|nr:fumarylacetoacetate hydrolase family protein [Chloroflexota bacterium]
MRLVVFDDYRIGVLDDAGIHDVSGAVPKWESGDVHGMNRLIAGWDSLRGPIERAAAQAAPKPVNQVRLRAPVPAPTHLLAAPVNFRAHQAEMKDQGFGKVPGSGAAGGGDTAETLGFFMKATGSITGAGDPIEIPMKDHGDRRFDHEGEIAFVIGKDARGVSPEEATKYIFGYTILIDATMRGTPERQEERVQRKSYYSFSPMGPCLTTADELPDWTKLNVKLWLNGEQRQDAHATDMIVNIPNLLSRASYVLPLRPGDVYTTGSPPGVGRIAPGDKVVVESPGIGQMTLAVVAREW